MKLHYIYVFLGIATLALNLALTVHLLKHRKSQVNSQYYRGNDVVTFRLSNGHNAGGDTTAAIPYDETLPLKEEL